MTQRVKVQAFLKMISGVGIFLSTSGCADAMPHIPAEKVKHHIHSLGVKPTQKIVVVDTKKQTMAILKDDKVEKLFTISTSNRGLGQAANTFKTPLGLHRINEKIGDGVPRYGIFHRRQFTGTTWRRQPKHAHRKDYISTRILRLEGLQQGFNKGTDKFGKLVDTERRAVYIHGTTMEWKLGAPSTKGCVHMSADDVIKLFNQVPVGTLVWIN